MAAIWSFPTRIVFGTGEAQSAGREARRLGMQRVLLVADPGVVNAGLVEPIENSLEQAGLSVLVFSNVDANPTEPNVENGAQAFAAHGADGIIAVGGGSPMDAAKLIGVRARTDRPFAELDDGLDGGRHIPVDLPPLITVPTTAGTGSEVGRAAALTVTSTHRKTIIFAPQMLAKVAILDPELTCSMPPRVTAATGFDALTHCVEAYLAKGDHPLADAIALGGVELIVENLERVMQQADDLEARGAMLKAAMMGAVAFQKGLGACHSLAHPLSSEHGLHHGLANALCLPAVVAFDQMAVPERVARLGRLLGDPDADGARAVAELRARVDLPGGLASVGLSAEMLDALVEKAFADGTHRDGVRPCTRDDLRALYHASL